MNSLNILSTRVISGRSASGPTRPRSRSQEPLDVLHKDTNARASSAPGSRSFSWESLSPRSVGGAVKENDPPSSVTSEGVSSSIDCSSYDDGDDRRDSSQGYDGTVEITTHDGGQYTAQATSASTILSTPLRIRYNLLAFANGLFTTVTLVIKIILSTLAAPAFYLMRIFHEEQYGYSLLAPYRKLRRTIASFTTSSTKHNVESPLIPSKSPRISSPPKKPRPIKTRGHSDRSQSSVPKRSRSRGSFSSCASDSDVSTVTFNPTTPQQSSRNNPCSTIVDRDPTPDQPRRSIRIECNDEGGKRRRRQRQEQLEEDSDGKYPLVVDLSTPDMLKSPMSSSIHKITKYPHSYPVPPRPLIPYRQSSYGRPGKTIPKKTLILDLDETLIHSLAKGGRMSSGHMVEVRLTTPVAATSATPEGSPITLGPQHPILYYVHKRPHCDDFLRKVCKWYKLVIFTASVQEYADPVIDWLEQERKYFHSRYYRQHCTFRHGAYIKDLSSVEPDLSKVMILDNSPMNNAIPIQGWISDPTDNDLLNLIPILEAMQYVTDVRALLALRRGEIEA
ncbi:Nuclear envelope morphology protein 1 [Ascosphaera aggregata]|nr:Nuclear envelope morphology protein 1 [Ascosphaera aggregata]